VVRQSTSRVVFFLAQCSEVGRLVYMDTANKTETQRTVDMGNNELRVIGIFPHQGGFMALTLAQSQTFKTRSGAERWLAKRGYAPNGQRLSA